MSVLVQITGDTFENLEKELGPFTGTKENWIAFGKKVNANVVFTIIQNASLVTQDMFKEGGKNYIILNYDGIPLLNKHTKQFIVGEKDLPKSLGGKVKTEEKVSATLDECRTIEDLNATIGAMYGGDLVDEQVGTVPTGETLKKFKQNKLFMMNSSANQFDCLIHSFLTSVSENFRRLPQLEKDAFASYFRRTLYPLILPTLRLTDEKIRTILGRVMIRAFLEDEDIEKICEFYKINMLVFEDEKRSDVLGYHENDKKSEKPEKPEKPKKLKVKTIKMPRCILYIDKNPESDAYMIYNNGGHFEAVRDKSGYIMKKAKAEEIHKENPCAFNEEQKVGCIYDEGQTVVFKGANHYVIYRRSNEDGTCAEYGLTDSFDRLNEFLELPPTEKYSSKVLSQYGTIKAKEEDLTQ